MGARRGTEGRRQRLWNLLALAALLALGIVWAPEPTLPARAGAALPARGAQLAAVRAVVPAAPARR